MFGLILLALLPLLAGFPSTIGWLHVNPLYDASYLVSHARPGLLGGLRTVDDNNGVQTQALGHLVAEQWLHGRIPWWNPYSGIGMPLAGEAQPSAFFLPFVLLLHFSNGVLILKYVTQVLAGLATFALLRRLRLRDGSALTGAALYELNGTFAWFGHAPILPIPFLPLLLLGIEYAHSAAAERRTGGWVAIAAAIAWSLAAGFPETAYIDGLMAAAWAIVRLAAEPRRWAMMGKLFAGGVAGLLIAAPSVWPFVHLLSVGTALGHDAIHPAAASPLARVAALLFPDLAQHLRAPFSVGYGTPAVGFPLLLFPYLFGNIGEALFTHALGPDRNVLYYLGGYLPASILFCAVCGLWGRRQRALRWMLAGWIVACLAKTGGVPLVSLLFDFVPLVGRAEFYRYSNPSWILAAVILCAFALDDWQTSAPLARRKLGLALAGIAVLSAAALLVSSPVLHPLLAEMSSERFYLADSLLLTFVMLAVLAAMLWRPAHPRRFTLISALLVTESCVLFMVPVLAGLRDPVLDAGLIDFLRRNVGTDRFYALASYRPNYGAFFDTPSINHDYLPLPGTWVEYVRATLDPTSDPQYFWGQLPGPGSQHVDAFRQRVTAYEEVGVRYVVTAHGLSPFDLNTGEHASDDVAASLDAGQSLAGSFTIPHGRGGQVDAVSVLVGTYAGAANGTLSVELCARSGCASRIAPLEHAADNAPFPLTLRSPLVVESGETTQWRITHQAGTHAVAIYLAANKDRPEPRLSFEMAGAPRRVYSDTVADVYELPAPKPYAETSGPCRLDIISREDFAADCSTPATLVRRELLFPGWRVSVNNADELIEAAATIFQQIPLPAGRSHIRFSYAPPFINAAWAACAAGALSICLGLLLSAWPATRSERLRAARMFGQ